MAADADSYSIPVGDTNMFSTDATGRIFLRTPPAEWIAGNGWTIQLRGSNANGSDDIQVVMTAKGVTSLAFVPSSVDWRVAQDTDAPIVLGSITANATTNNRFALPSAPTLTASGDDGALICLLYTSPSPRD